MAENAEQFQKMITDQRTELKQLRAQQQTVFDIVFNAGMKQITRVTNVDARELPAPDDDE
jgi:hypothetical protein